MTRKGSEIGQNAPSCRHGSNAANQSLEMRLLRVVWRSDSVPVQTEAPFTTTAHGPMCAHPDSKSSTSSGHDNGHGPHAYSLVQCRIPAHRESPCWTKLAAAHLCSAIRHRCRLFWVMMMEWQCSLAIFALRADRPECGSQNLGYSSDGAVSCIPPCILTYNLSRTSAPVQPSSFLVQPMACKARGSSATSRS